MTDNDTRLRAIDTVRLLAADAVQKAESGHPGMPMGCADFAFTLWHKFLRHNPMDPDWLGRDRFILSAGHGSTLLYSMLHLFEYGVTREDLKQFRQRGSNTPGHPEFGHTPGVEVTTGPLASGLATGVGMAIAAKQLSARMGNRELFDQRIFVLSSDGCMMEGTSHEACALAAHQELDNLICFYDDNSITIEGNTSLTFSEDVGRRFEAYGWRVIKIDAQDISQIEEALTDAIQEKRKPCLIIGRTTIGYGSPNRAGSAEIHGAPLGGEELVATKNALGFPSDKSFFVPEQVSKFCHRRVEELKTESEKWDHRLRAFAAENPEKEKLLGLLLNRTIPGNILEELLAATPESETATRSSGGAVLQRAAELVPSLCGGAADLNPSTKTYLAAESDFSASERSGRNIHYGVRELGMGLTANGLGLFGTAIPFSATFTVFSDYMKPAIRLAAIQGIHEIYVFTHDSIFVGEDGPTHQPVEHMSMLRSIPGLTVIRPAESHEVAHSWAAALQADGPVAMMMTRQKVENISSELCKRIDLIKGGYVLSEDEGFDLIIIATGSELMPAYHAAETLRTEGHRIRVVSLPSWELFEKQPEGYRDSVLPGSCTNRVTVEAGITMGWHRYAGSGGLTIGVDHFGHSAPYSVLAEEYGLTSEAIAGKIRRYIDTGSRR